MAVVVGYTPTNTGFLAVTEAVREARSHGAAVVIVNVVGVTGFASPTAAEDQDLDSLTAWLTADGVEHSVRQIESHDPVADLLLAVADEVGARLIVVGLKRRSPFGKVLLGSTAQTVILTATVPVLTVRGVDD
jgi:nucleotide-binding universal stress UspA family protein